MASGGCPFKFDAMRQESVFSLSDIKQREKSRYGKKKEKPATMAPASDARFASSKPMVGGYLLWQPSSTDTTGRTSVYITTVHESGSDRSKHRLKGLAQCTQGRHDDWQWEIATVNDVDVRGWAHYVLTDWLTELKAEEDITLVLVGDGDKDEITIKVHRDLIEDGSIGDKVRCLYEMTVRVQQKLTTSVNIQRVRCHSQMPTRVRHGALTKRFLRGKEEHVCMDSASDPPEHVFHCYRFSGIESVDGEGAKTVFLCVLQEKGKDYYVAPCPKFTAKLRAVQASALDENIHEIKSADPRFFEMIESGQGQSTYYLRPLIYKDYYLCYDAMEKLKLERCETPPYEDHDTARNFTFEFIPDFEP